MGTTIRALTHRKLRAMGLTSTIALLAAMGFLTSDAWASFGPDLLQITGITGDWSGDGHKSWVRVEGHYWTGVTGPLLNRGGQRGAGAGGRGGGPVPFAGTAAPKSGPGRLVLAIDKHSLGLPKIMAKCAAKEPLGDLVFAENSELARTQSDKGPLPAGVPAFFEHQLKNVVISDCTVAADAGEQALILKFDDIALRNFQMPATPYALPPNNPAPLQPGGKTKAFAISWFALAGDISDDQCPAMNAKAEEGDYYAYVPKDEAAKEQQALKTTGGVRQETGQMGMRGPARQDVSLLPGIVRDPGFIEPRTSTARGFDLDGDDGSGKPPPGVCKHVNYTSPDGRKGIDSELYRVQGCVMGYMGHKGTYTQIQNIDQRRNARTTLMLQISGIDDEKNDDHVQVTIITSRDPMPKNADGSIIPGNYSFRPATDPLTKFYETRLNGRIENGVIITEKTPMLRIPANMEYQFNQAQLRLEILPNGNLKGILGGYLDWRRVLNLVPGSNQEQVYGMQVPGMYNALKRHADGMLDPATGRCMGISSMYDIEGSPAFLVSPADDKAPVQTASQQPYGQ